MLHICSKDQQLFIADETHLLFPPECQAQRRQFPIPELLLLTQLVAMIESSKLRWFLNRRGTQRKGKISKPLATRPMCLERERKLLPINMMEKQ